MSVVDDEGLFPERMPVPRALDFSGAEETFFNFKPAADLHYRHSQSLNPGLYRRVRVGTDMNCSRSVLLSQSFQPGNMIPVFVGKDDMPDPGDVHIHFQKIIDEQGRHAECVKKHGFPNQKGKPPNVFPFVLRS
jgi:hypothetical protein